MSFTSPEFSIEDASNRKMKLPEDLQKLEARGHVIRCESDPMLCKLCDMTDAAVLRVLAKGA